MSLKLKLISVVALFTLMLGILIMGVFAATQSINLTGSLNFNIPDRSLYVKDIRIKQDLNEEPVSLEGFMPGYLNSNYTLDLTNVTETNTYSSFTLYFDVINTTESMWEIKNVTLPTTLEEQGVFVSGYSGRVEVNSTLTDANGDSYKEITDVANTTYSTLTISISNPNASIDNPLSLDGIVITIDEYVPTVTTIAVGENATETSLGLATSEGYAIVGEEITLNVEFAGADADFLGWKTSEEATEYISTLPSYTFTFEEDSPTTYYAVFTEPEELLSYTYNTPATGEAQLASCSSGAIDITVPSAIYRTDSAYTVTSMYYSSSNFSGVFYQTRSTLQSVSLPDTLTNIGSYAFYNCSGLTGDLVIPEGVTSIGDWAFSGCSGLTGNLVISSSVTSIGNSAFYNCNGLTGDLIIPSSVTSIGVGSFMYCSGLTGNLVISSSVTSIGSNAFEGCSGLTGDLVIPSSVTSIGDYAFAGCSELTGDLIIPSSVTSIGFCSFMLCSGLTGDLVIPSSVTSIGDYAFSECSNLTGDLIIPSSVTSIGDYVFENCSSLTSITIPSSVTNIGSSAFAGCSELTGDLVIPSGVTGIGSQAFYNCSGLTGDLVIPEGVTSIGSYAFSNCSSLTSITIPSSVTSIGSYAFSSCSGLEGISVEEGNSVYHSSGNCLIETDSKALIAGCNNSTIPTDGSVISIDNSAFVGCSGLTSISIPSSVISIGNSAFYRCSGLTSITINATEPPSLISGAFDNTNNAPIYVPAGTVETYQAADGWSDYADRILAIA